MFAYCGDSSLKAECVLYIQTYRARFRVVDDAWKGEDNFWEPNRFWIEEAKKSFPGSQEALEIEFDLDFKEFIRQFNIDEEAKGKTCQEYYDEDLKDNLDAHEVYSKEEIARWPEECEHTRYEFTRGRLQILQKYKYAPYTKILQDIDITTIVVFHSVC